MDVLSSLGLPRCVLSWTPCRSSRALVSGSPQASASARPSFSSWRASELLSAPSLTCTRCQTTPEFGYVHYIRLGKAANQSRSQFQGCGLQESEPQPACSAARKGHAYVLLLPLLLEHLWCGDRELTLAPWSLSAGENKDIFFKNSIFIFYYRFLKCYN